MYSEKFLNYTKIMSCPKSFLNNILKMTNFSSSGTTMPPTIISKGKLFCCRVRSTLITAVSTFLQITTTLQPNFTFYKHYFTLHRSIISGDSEVTFYFKAYLLFCAYMTLAWVICLFQSPLSVNFSPVLSLTLRLLLMDNLDILGVAKYNRHQFYLLEVGLAASLPIFQWAIYARPKMLD